jgi:hypothetical protein
MHLVIYQKLQLTVFLIARMQKKHANLMRGPALRELQILIELRDWQVSARY